MAAILGSDSVADPGYVAVVGTTEYLSRDDGWNLRRSNVSTTTVMNDATDYTKSTNSGNLTTQAATINWPNPPGIGERWYLGGL